MHIVLSKTTDDSPMLTVTTEEDKKISYIHAGCLETVFVVCNSGRLQVYLLCAGFCLVGWLYFVCAFFVFFASYLSMMPVNPYGGPPR